MDQCSSRAFSLTTASRWDSRGLSRLENLGLQMLLEEKCASALGITI